MSKDFTKQTEYLKEKANEIFKQKLEHSPNLTLSKDSKIFHYNSNMKIEVIINPDIKIHE